MRARETAFILWLSVLAQAADKKGNVFEHFMHQSSKLYHCVMSYKNETIDDVHFFLYTRRNRMKPEELDVPVRMEGPKVEGTTTASPKGGGETTTNTPLHAKSRYLSLGAPPKGSDKVELRDGKETKTNTTLHAKSRYLSLGTPPKVLEQDRDQSGLRSGKETSTNAPLRPKPRYLRLGAPSKVLEQGRNQSELRKASTKTPLHAKSRYLNLGPPKDLEKDRGAEVKRGGEVTTNTPLNPKTEYLNLSTSHNQTTARKRRAPTTSTPLYPSSPIKSKYFNLRAPTKVIVHGYNQSSEDKRMLQIKRAYLARGEYNVILVDWRTLAISPCYSNAAAHTHWVGNRTADLIGGLSAGGAEVDSVHVVGFSLGAQVAGYAGIRLSPLIIGRITGLDPALPLFAFVHPADRLDASDARFVDIIHTNGGALGYGAAVGHADFYPNGGQSQPGCSVSDVFCSHGRAPALYLESVRSRVGFKALACRSYWEFRTRRCNRSRHLEFLGDPCSPHANGSYFLYTHDKKPFAIR